MKTVLKTKLYAPQYARNLVRRSRLVQFLHAGISRRLTLISAPAGFGKTTLISEWISQSEARFCWISLDENDSDPGRFLAYFIARLGTIGIEIEAENSGIFHMDGLPVYKWHLLPYRDSKMPPTIFVAFPERMIILLIF